MPSLRALTAAVPLAAALALPAGTSQAIPPGGPAPNARGAKITLKTTSVARGGKIRVTGSKLPQRKGSITVKLDDSAILAVFRISSRGTFSGSVPIPRQVRRGNHWLRFLAPSPATSVKKTFRVR